MNPVGEMCPSVRVGNMVVGIWLMNCTFTFYCQSLVACRVGVAHVIAIVLVMDKRTH